MTLEWLAELALLKEQNAQLVKERDAAIADAKEFGGCRSCVHHDEFGDCIGALLSNDCWEWRGVQDE